MLCKCFTIISWAGVSHIPGNLESARIPDTLPWVEHLHALHCENLCILLLTIDLVPIQTVHAPKPNLTRCSWVYTLLDAKHSMPACLLTTVGHVAYSGNVPSPNYIRICIIPPPKWGHPANQVTVLGSALHSSVIFM